MKTAGHKAVTSGFAVVEVMTRYSSNPTLLDDLRNAREEVLPPGKEDEAELGGERRANGRRWAVAHRSYVLAEPDGTSRRGA
jgi:hypothetical protein